MGGILRLILAVLAGVVVAIVLLIAVEFFSAIVHPFPDGFDGSTEQMCAHVAKYPQWVLAVCVPMWGVTAGLSTWVTQHIGGRAAALVIGVLLVAAVVLNVSMLPYPMWFKVASLIVVGLATDVARRRTMATDGNEETPGTV